MNGIYINEMGKDEDAFISTAMDDYSVRYLPEDTMILHCFQHTGVNMGWDDTRMEQFDLGLQYYQDNNTPVIIRNSGGRCIVSDMQVLNMSLTIRTDMTMAACYDYYAEFIKEALQPFTNAIVSGEIHGAYCPGASDLSIDGKKFCGTAQRKRKDVVSLVCYISVAGNQQARGELVKGFYEAMGTDAVLVMPETMDTLENLCQQTITPQQVAEALKETLVKRTTNYQEHTGYDTTTEAFKVSLNMTLRHNKGYAHAL